MDEIKKRRKKKCIYREEKKSVFPRINRVASTTETRLRAYDRFGTGQRNDGRYFDGSENVFLFCP